MKGFRVILIIGLALGIFTVVSLIVVVTVLSILKAQKESREEDQNKDVVHDVFGDKKVVLFYFVRSAVSFAVQIYFFICINSLYHEIEEENTGAHLPVHNVSSNQQHKLEGIDNIVYQSPPAYNEMMQSDRTTQVAIPDVYSGDSKLKPQSV